MSGNTSGGVAVTGESSSGGVVFSKCVRKWFRGVSTSGPASVCAGEERSSLFSDSGNRLPLFNPFAAAMATLGPAERYESQYMGANEFLNRRLNEKFQRVFDAEIPSSAIYPSPKIYHIGTPSDRTTLEGFQSALSHGISSVPSYPTSSPLSFEPLTPVQSASAVPAGLQSSPGGMSDVGSTLTPPELPSRDPPRMAEFMGYLWMTQCLTFLLEVFLVGIQVIDLHQPKLRFHLYLYNKELEIQLHSCLWDKVQ